MAAADRRSAGNERRLHLDRTVRVGVQCNLVRRILAVGVVVFGAACTTTQADPNTGPTTGASPVSEASISPAVTASIELGAPSTSIALGEGAVWVRTASNTVVRLDPESAEIVATIDVPGGVYGNVAVGAGAVWVTGFDTNTLYRIDPGTNEITDEIEVGLNPEGLAATSKAVWVSNHRAGSVSRVNPRTSRVVATVLVGPEGPSGPKNIAMLDGQPWLAVINNGKVVSIDPTTNELDFQESFVNFNGGPDLDGTFASDRTVFAIVDTQVTPIDAQSQTDGNAFRPPYLPAAFGQSAFWTVAGGDLLRLQADTLEPVASWHIGQAPDAYVAIAVGEDELWLLFVDTGLVLRVEPT